MIIITEFIEMLQEQARITPHSHVVVLHEGELNDTKLKPVEVRFNGQQVVVYTEE